MGETLTVTWTIEPRGDGFVIVEDLGTERTLEIGPIPDAETARKVALERKAATIEFLDRRKRELLQDALVR